MDGTSTGMQRYSVAIIGAGLGGIALSWYLKTAGIENFAVFEKAADVGGTWRENTYPGAGCDVPSHMYSFSFARHYPWAYRYGKQPEILAYARYCVAHNRLEPYLHFNAEVTAARFDANTGRWRLAFADGRQCETEMLVSAVGQLSRPQLPDIPGRERFHGPAFHSARWNHDFDLHGKRVAVIGTGASAIQFVPEIATHVAHLDLYQRSPGWTIAKHERRRSAFANWAFNHVPGLLRLNRLRIFLVMEFLAYAYNGHPRVERLVRFISQQRLRRQVADPALRARLTPDFPVGCKRILLTSDWYRTLTRDNVEVISEAIAEINATGVKTVDGRQRDVDAIIYGTGFAATEFLAPMHISGRDGRDLHSAWKSGAEAYLGMAIAGFPNFFVMYGPNTNLGSGSVTFMLECQSRYIAKIAAQRIHAHWKTVEIGEPAYTAYVNEMDIRSTTTTYHGACHSWYKNAAGRNTNNWIGSCTEYWRRTRRPRFSDYRVSA